MAEGTSHRRLSCGVGHIIAKLQKPWETMKLCCDMLNVNSHIACLLKQKAPCVPGSCTEPGGSYPRAPKLFTPLVEK